MTDLVKSDILFLTEKVYFVDCEKGAFKMAFWSALASYGIVLLVFVCVGAVAIFLGITLRKKKDAKLAVEGAGKELMDDSASGETQG